MTLIMCLGYERFVTPSSSLNASCVASGSSLLLVFDANAIPSSSVSFNIAERSQSVQFFTSLAGDDKLVFLFEPGDNTSF